MGTVLKMDRKIAQIRSHNGHEFTIGEMLVLIGAGFHIIETSVGSCVAVSDRRHQRRYADSGRLDRLLNRT